MDTQQLIKSLEKAGLEVTLCTFEKCENIKIYDIHTGMGNLSDESKDLVSCKLCHNIYCSEHCYSETICQSCSCSKRKDPIRACSCRFRSYSCGYCNGTFKLQVKIGCPKHGGIIGMPRIVCPACGHWAHGSGPMYKNNSEMLYRSTIWRTALLPIINVTCNIYNHLLHQNVMIIVKWSQITIFYYFFIRK